MSYYIRTLCFRILSHCLSRDIHFQHDFQHQKTQFLQLFPPFPPACPPPLFFSFGGILRTRHPPSKSPAFLPFIFPFRGRPSQPHFPIVPPHFLPAPIYFTDEMYNQIGTFPSKIKAFSAQIIPALGRNRGIF